MVDANAVESLEGAWVAEALERDGEPHVQDGSQAVHTWQGGGIDVRLMDLQMPEMDGLAATRSIRAQARARGLAATPIIALTTNALHSNEESSIKEAGMLASLFTAPPEQEQA